MELDTNYMSGWSSKGAFTAHKIDAIADKTKFVSEMLENNLLALDGVENELKAYARGSVPPQPQMLVGLAERLDSIQSQLKHGLKKIQELSRETDLATDNLQSSSGWK